VAAVDTYEQALGILAATPPILRALAAAGSTEALARRPTEAAWSPREVLAHLWRSETFLGSRIRLLLEQNEPALESPVYGQAPDELGTLLHEWQAARSRNLALFRSLKPEQRARGGSHVKHGRITIRELVVECAYHDLDHLRQIMGGWQVELYPDIGTFQGLYLPPG
jgi:hypothetical protein